MSNFVQVLKTDEVKLKCFLSSKNYHRPILMQKSKLFFPILILFIIALAGAMYWFENQEASPEDNQYIALPDSLIQQLAQKDSTEKANFLNTPPPKMDEILRQNEMFFEQNRTGYPKVSTVPQTNESYVPGEFAYSVNGTTGGKFPKRLEFPSNVLTRNQNAPALVPVTTTVWWDVN